MSGRKSKSKSAKKSSTNVLYQLLPFGIPQFAQGKTLLGVAFGAGQTGGLGFWYMKNQAADAKVDEIEQQLAVMAEECDTAACRNDRAQYQAENQNYINGMRSQANYGLYAFGALYAGSVLESFLFDSAPAPKKKKKRKYSGFSLMPDHYGESLAALTYTDAVREDATFEYGLGVGLHAPASQTNADLQQSVILGTYWTF